PSGDQDGLSSDEVVHARVSFLLLALEDAGPDNISTRLTIYWRAATLLAMAPDDRPGTAAHLGRNIQTLREARGRTQEQIARVAGIPRATWANLESGAANPTLAVLIKVAQALQVRLE